MPRASIRVNVNTAKTHALGQREQWRRRRRARALRRLDAVKWFRVSRVSYVRERFVCHRRSPFCSMCAFFNESQNHA